MHDNDSNIHLAGQLLHDKYSLYHETCAKDTLQLCLKTGLQALEIVFIAADMRKGKSICKLDCTI